MKKRTAEKIGYTAGAGAAALVGLIAIASLFGLSWIATCGIIKLIALCFGWTFKWSVATGIWLIICIARTIFSNNTTTNK